MAGKIRINTTGLSRKLTRLEMVVREEIEKTFFRLVKKAEEAMNKRIQDYDDGQTPEGLRHLFEQPNYQHMKPVSGQLREALHTSIEAPRVIKRGNKYSRDIFSIDILDNMTDWNGSMKTGKRPIQSANKWKNNPYPENGYWKTYDMGFNWGDVRIYGRNFTGAGKKAVEFNIERELRNMKARIYYRINKL